MHQQLIVLNRSIKKPQIKTKDRLFWIILYLFWNSWQESLIVLKPETVVGWHKKDSKIEPFSCLLMYQLNSSPHILVTSKNSHPKSQEK